MAQSLSHKKIVLTGGTSGIGRALAQQLVAEGAEVLVIGRKTKKDTDLPAGCHYCQSDLSTSSSLPILEEMLDTLNWTACDHLILNASVGFVGEFQEENADNIAMLIDTNLTMPLCLCRLLYPYLENAKGSVVFIGSTVIGKVTPYYAVYTATKTALSDLARNLNTEWQDHVRVQEINPGPTRTNFHKKSGLEKPPLAFLYMKPEDVASGIIRSLKTGKRRKSYPVSAILFHAAKRLIMRKAA